MLISPAPLAATAAALRGGQLDLLTYIDEACSCIDAAEPLIHALLPEQGRRQRLLTEAESLQKRFPEPASRPPLYGILLGVKDIFRVAGFPTQAGSQLPAELFAGPEAACVTLLRNAGALILGKTISTEFAWIEPGPTRNPHNLDHTPGGSSSRPAPAVAAGFCPLALATQTIVFAEMAQVHADWFASYETLYRPLTVTAIHDGQKVGAEALQTARAGQAALGVELEVLMARHGIDLWLSPAAPGPAPQGITTTGNSIMNLPWTYTGMPAITLPAGHAANGLPLGLQITGAALADENLVSWAQQLAESLG